MAGYGDDEARRIIERAAEIDADDQRRFDALAIREMAADSGISPSAVDRALREHERMAPSREPWHKRYRSAIVVAAIIAALALWTVLRRVIPTPF